MESGGRHRGDGNKHKTKNELARTCGKGDFDPGFRRDAEPTIPEHSEPPPLLMLAVCPSLILELCCTARASPADMHLPLPATDLCHVQSRAPSSPPAQSHFQEFL